MLSKEERMANLKRASAMSRVQDSQIQNMLNNMDDNEVNNFIDANPEVADMLAVGADSDNSGIIVNYKDMPNNQHEDIDCTPPWEVNFAAAGQEAATKRTNLFQVGQNPVTGMSFGGNGFYNNYYYGMSPNDERIKRYTNGMKMYNITPYSFQTANQMVDYFDYCEEQREFQENQKYGWALLSARCIGTKEALEWAESFKFKPADQIYEERIKAQEEAQKAKIESYESDGNNIIYGVYDRNGVRCERAFSVKIIDAKTKEVVRETKHEKDALGQSYITKTQIQDRKEQYELQMYYNQLAYHQRYINTFAKLFYQSYIDNKNRWQSWRDAGLSLEEQYALWEDQRIDWKKQDQMVRRALSMAAFSRDSFNEILSSCCDTSLDYSSRSKVFSLSYDFERDLHYKTLISSPEEMDNDPLVHRKLQEEYDIKKKRFLDKVLSGNLAAPSAPDATFHPTCAKPRVDDLTLEDYDKPENQVMYTKMFTPHLATENLFIPKVEERTVGVMTVDDDTGQIVSQYEEKVNPEDSSEAKGFFSKIGQLSDDEMSKLF